MIRNMMNRWALVALAGVAVAAATHTVVKGDTLWDITGHYLGNPFQWPMVWKKNPQIKNAHWIYPGDTVVLDGVPATQTISSGSGDTANPGLAAHPSNDPLASFQQSPSAFRPIIDSSVGAPDLIVPPDHSYINEETMYLAPVLVPIGQFGKYAFEGKIDWNAGSGLQQLFPGNLVQVDIGSDKVKVGDRLQVVETGDQVCQSTVANLRGRLEQTRAILLVAEVRPKSSMVRVERVFGEVTRNVVVRPLEVPVAPKVVGFIPQTESDAGKVLANTASGRVQLPGSFVIIDRGEAQGIGPGDIEEFMDADRERGLDAMRGYGMVVRTTVTTSTILLVGSTPKPILPGDRAWRVRRAKRG